MNTKQRMAAILKSRSERESDEPMQISINEPSDVKKLLRPVGVGSEAVTGESNALRVFNIETGLIGAGFFAKCGSVYTGGWSTERKAFNAAKALLRKRNPDAIFKQDSKEMMEYSHEEIQDAQSEAMSDAFAEYLDQQEEFRDYLRDDGSADYGDGFNN